MSTNLRIEDLLASIEELSRFLEEENRLIRNREFNQVRERTVEKNLLANRYENHIHALEANGAVADNWAKPDRQRLKVAGDRMHDLVMENAILLTAQREATQHVINAFAQAVKETQSKAGTYSKNGALSRDMAHKKRVAPASVDQSL